MSLIIRLDSIIKHFSKNVTEFAREMDFNTETLRRIYNGTTKDPQISLFIKIKERYPEIDLEWLLTGEGEMLSKHKRTEVFCESCIKKDGKIEYLEEHLEKCQKKNDKLNQMVGDLVSKLENSKDQENYKANAG